MSLLINFDSKASHAVAGLIGHGFGPRRFEPVSWSRHVFADVLQQLHHSDSRNIGTQLKHATCNWGFFGKRWSESKGRSAFTATAISISARFTSLASILWG